MDQSAAYLLGWYLCDGANGTPDLRDRFVVGAGSTYSVAATGGATTATLVLNNLPAHTHTATVTDPGHLHTYDRVAGTAGAAGGGASVINLYPLANTSTATTGITVSNASTGSGTSFSLLNPYYALAYMYEVLIMEIDPVKYGVLWQKVQDYERRFDQMETKIDKMELSIEKLVALANQGRGGFWAGMALVSALSSAVGYVSHWVGKN
jgi:microcystin-dependent protein